MREHPWVTVAVAVTGVGLAWIVGHDGSAPWQLLRVVAVAAAAVLLARRRPMPLLGLAGALGVAVGAGFGLPHLAKAGVAVDTVAGLAALAGGAALVVVALRLGTRHLRRWRRALAVAGPIVPGLVLVSSLAIAVAATNVPRTAVGARTPAALGLAFRDVVFETTDGVRLSAWYVPGPGPAAAVLLHGAGSTRSSVLDEAAVLHDLGLHVLLVDARGHGRSGGRAMDFGWYGDRDVGAAVTALARLPGVDDRRIVAVGLSMGGEEAIGAAGADRRIRAVVAEGATGRVPADHGWLSDRYGLRGALQEGIEHLRYGLAGLLTDAPRPASLRAAVAHAAPAPVLLITAGRRVTFDPGNRRRVVRR